MNRQDIANLTFKVVGLYCLIQALEQLGWIVDAAIRVLAGVGGVPQQANMGWLLALSSLVGPGLLGAMGVYLLARSHALAHRVFPQSESDGPPARILAIHALAFSVVGVFVIADSLPQTLGTLVSLGLAWNQMGGMGYADIARYVGVPLVKVVFGLALLFGSHGLVRLWSQLRYAGIREKLGLCTACGYDLTGNTSGVCPECGTPKPGAPGAREVKSAL